MKTPLPLQNWHRKDHFAFFSQFEEPFFGVCVPIDCTIAYNKAKKEGYSFYLYYLYQSLVAANNTEPFRYRIEGSEIFVHDVVHASPTVNRPDGTFGYAYMDYHATWPSFYETAQQETARVQAATGLITATTGENVLHYSAMPWLNFTSVSHARSFSFKDCIPKIAFGKFTESNGRKTFPVSVHVHHALMDGLHVGQFVQLFQELMNTP